jgi:hypothetical protein
VTHWCLRSVSLRYPDRGAQVVVVTQGETQCIIDYRSMAETTKGIRPEYKTQHSLYTYLGGNNPYDYIVVCHCVCCHWPWDIVKCVLEALIPVNSYTDTIYRRRSISAMADIDLWLEIKESPILRWETFFSYLLQSIDSILCKGFMLTIQCTCFHVAVH